jgi:hypothetical protein
MEKNRSLNINRPSNLKKKSPLTNVGNELTDKKTETLQKHNGGIARTPKICNGSGNVQIGIFKRFLLNIKSYYRRTVKGVKKGYSINTVPPETVKLLSKPLIWFFNILGVICMSLCLTQRIFYFNIYLQYFCVIIYIMHGFFLIYISIIRFRYTNKLIKAGQFEVRNSPLDQYSYRIAKTIGRSRAVVSFGLSAATALGSVYTIDCVMKELGYEPIFLPFIKSLLPQPRRIISDPTIASDREHDRLKTGKRIREKKIKFYRRHRALPKFV